MEIFAMQAVTAIGLKANQFQLALKAIHPMIARSYRPEGASMRILRSVVAAFIALNFFGWVTEAVAASDCPCKKIGPNLCIRRFRAWTRPARALASRTSFVPASDKGHFGFFCQISIGAPPR